MTNQRARLRGLLFFGLLLSALPCFAQFDDDDEFPPGIVGQYTVGEKSIERIDPDIAFVWNKSAPDQRLPIGPFKASWKTQLLIKREARYRFHAFLTGTIKVVVDGKTVLDSKSDQPGWVSGTEIDLGFGEKQLEVEFQKTQPTARVQLYWSADSFTLEPISDFLFFREGGNAALSQFERGRIQFRAHRCNRCHQAANEPVSPSAPALSAVADGTSLDWLIDKIQNPHVADEVTRMPSFGFSKDKAAAIAEFLVSVSGKVKLESAPKPKKDDGRKGEILLRSVGCLACHQMGEHGNANAFAGGNLSKIGSKRSRDWIYTWLAHPDRLNADHRMPIFKLNSTERRQLAVALTPDATNSNTAKRDSSLVKKGRELVEAARCVACHSVSKLKVDVSGIPNLSKPIQDWSKSCLAEKPNRRTYRPAYRGIDHKAIKTFVESRHGELSPESNYARGRRIIEERNCLACHERGLAKGIVATAGTMARVDRDLSGQSQGLIPPNLSAVGDKFLNKALAAAVSGEQKNIRLPWLRVRMPRFQHQSDDKQALVDYLQGHDQIPPGAPASIVIPKTDDESIDEQTLIVGHTLVGAKGFSCIACHIVGDYQPRNVALGTRGSDLMNLKGTMRREYFLRWTRSPLRIVPGMEMPSYVKPVPGILQAKIDAQLNAMWDALNDSRFKPPTNPSIVEQFVTVKPGEPSRVVRDVFTNPKENGGGYVARAFAVGMNNGHNIIIDLDTFALRQWTFGDFARQRTSGKSWYWDMAGIPVMSGFRTESDFALRKKGTKDAKLILPKRDNGTNGKLMKYGWNGAAMVLQYFTNFEIDGKIHSLKTIEFLKPHRPAQKSRTGWQRLVVVNFPIPGGYDVLISRPVTKNSIGAPTIEAVDIENAKWLTFKEMPGREYITLAKKEPPAPFSAPDWHVKLEYTCSLKPEAGQLKPIKPAQPPKIQTITSAPGFDGLQLPFAESIMPTAITWRTDGTMAFASLKGHVYTAHDSTGDDVEDRLKVFDEGLSAPYGLIADGEKLIVSHKPELLALKDLDGDGRAELHEVLATGWGFNDNYHDWVCGISRDSHGNLFVGLGSDYSQKNRPKEFSRWRGKVLRIDPKGKVTPFGHAFRYPTGLAIDSKDRLFVTDNQGVQNTFNEINWVREGLHFGVPSIHERDIKVVAHRPAIQVPHPMTRSVNGLFFLPNDFAYPQLAGHGIGCEYNGRFLIRFTYQEVGESIQGATYYFTKPNYSNADENFLGPLCGAVSPDGDIFIGSIHDSGWLGGRNTGSIVRLHANGKLPNGIRELRAFRGGFEIEFFSKVDAVAASKRENYSISGYTRVWKGSYTTSDSGRHRVKVESIKVLDGGKMVRLHVDQLKEKYVYDVSCSDIGMSSQPKLWPNTGHYTMNQIPK